MEREVLTFPRSQVVLVRTPRNPFSAGARPTALYTSSTPCKTSMFLKIGGWKISASRHETATIAKGQPRTYRSVDCDVRGAWGGHGLAKQIRVSVRLCSGTPRLGLRLQRRDRRSATTPSAGWPPRLHWHQRRARHARRQLPGSQLAAG